MNKQGETKHPRICRRKKQQERRRPMSSEAPERLQEQATAGRMMEGRGEEESPKMKGLIQSGPLSFPLFSNIAKKQIVGSPAFSSGPNYMPFSHRYLTCFQGPNWIPWLGPSTGEESPPLRHEENPSLKSGCRCVHADPGCLQLSPANTAECAVAYPFLGDTSGEK